MFVLSLATRSQVILERVHVWWEIGDLLEDEAEIYVETERDKMHTCENERAEICNQKDIGGCCVGGEDTSPSPFSARCLQVLVSGQESSDDEKPEKASVHQSSETMVAR